MGKIDQHILYFYVIICNYIVYMIIIYTYHALCIYDSIQHECLFEHEPVNPGEI